MKYLILILIFACINLNNSSSAHAQEDNLLAEEVKNDDFSFDESEEDLTDDEDIDFETEDFVEAGDTELSTDDQQAKNAEQNDNVSIQENQELSETENSIESNFKENAEQNDEFTFHPADSYGTFRNQDYEWSVFAHYGYQFANVSSDFASSTSLTNLPNEYNDVGLDIVKNLSNSSWLFGGRLQVMTESVEDDTTKTDYAMNLITAFAGYKFINDIISVAGTFGVILPLSTSAEISTISGSTSTEKDFKIDLSYTVGVMSVIKMKRFLLGFDGGLMFLQGQKLDDEDFDRNQGGYLRGLLGLAF